MDTSIAPAPEQSGIFENPQMFRNRRERHVVRPGEVGNAPVAPRQVRENLPARGIGQRGKSLVQRSRGIFNHLVNYLAASLQRATFFCYNLQKPNLGVCFAGLPILKRIDEV